jgi:cytoskeletal protein RodZ
MLAHLLAVAVAVGSFGLYFSAFFFPEVHRKSDFYWSGLGLFYALVLWVCAGRITGGVLLGQMASAALLLWFGTQTVILRRHLASPEEKTNISQTIASPFQFLSPKTLWQKIRGGNKQPTPPSPSETSSTSSPQSQQQQEPETPTTEGEQSEATSTPSNESQSQPEQETSTSEPSSSETSSTLNNESRQEEDAEKTDLPNQPTEERPSNQKGAASSSDSD